MNNLLQQIRKLTTEINQQWNQIDSLVSKTITQMSLLNIDLVEDFFTLLENNKSIAACIVARPVYERSVFLQFILHDRREISSRALLFYHSSRLRQYLWLNYILRDENTFKNFHAEYNFFEKQNQKLAQKNNQTLAQWVSDQIEKEKEAFNRIEHLVHYCDISIFDRDVRRKTWYRLDPETFGGNLKLSTLSDVSKYVLNDSQNYYYNLFYGIDSLFTHGYLVPEIFLKKTDEFKIALLTLLIENLKALSQYLDLTQNQQKQLAMLSSKISRLRFNPAPINTQFLEQSLNATNIAQNLKKQIEENFASYHFLANKKRNYALYILLRTLNEQVLSWKWMHLNHPEIRIKLFALTSQIQAINDLYRFTPDGSTLQTKLSELRQNKKDTYDELAIPLMREHTIHKDKQKRRWFVLESEDKTVHSLHQLEQCLLPNGKFIYLYANGFLSVHVHGINLELPFKLHQQDVFLLSGTSDASTCHHVACHLWKLFTSEEQK
ncbi:DUF5677 domain-containing protein [Ligilactobacillus sp. LYQ135]